MTNELNQRDSKLSQKDTELEKLKTELEKERNKNLSTFISEVFSKNVFGFIDEPSLKIIDFLNQGPEDIKSIKKKVKLSHGEFLWRIEYLKSLGLVIPTYTNNRTIYQLSTTFQRIFSSKVAFLERGIAAQNDIVMDLSHKAVGGDEHGAKRLRLWLKGKRRKRHNDILQKLKKKYHDPIKVSQAFFGMREMGTSHEKHIGVRIEDHQSSGELLFLGLQ